MLIKIGQTRDRLDDVRRLVHDDDAGGSQTRFVLAQRIEIHQHIFTD